MATLASRLVLLPVAVLVAVTLFLLQLPSPCRALILRVAKGGKQCVGEQLILDELAYVRFQPYTTKREHPLHSFDVRATDPNGNVVFARERRRNRGSSDAPPTAVSFTANVDGVHQVCVHSRAAIVSEAGSDDLLVRLDFYAGGEAKALAEEHAGAGAGGHAAEVARVALAQHGGKDQLSSAAAQALHELQLCAGVSESVHHEVRRGRGLGGSASLLQAPITC